MKQALFQFYEKSDRDPKSSRNQAHRLSILHLKKCTDTDGLVLKMLDAGKMNDAFPTE